MSTAAVDTARTNELLSAFMSEIGNADPIDNHFPKRPVLDALLRNKKVQDWGRQVLFTIDQGVNPTIKDFSGYDTFDLSAPDTVLTVVYPMVNKGGVIQLSWEDKRETAGSDHKIFDLVAQRRSNAIKSLMDALATDVFASSASSVKVSNLPSMILDTGSVGNLSQSTSADWASTVTASGAFNAQGLADMRTLYNTIVNNGADPDFIFTTQTIYEAYEKEVDPDVRYAIAQGVGGRGFRTLEFKMIPIVHDKKATSGVIYMGALENLYFCVDTKGNFVVDDFQSPVNQKSSVAIMAFRGQLVTDRRKSLGKLTGVS